MGWGAMEQGLREQFRQLEALREEGFLTLETLADSGRDFKRNYKLSPPTAICALKDWKNENRAAIWYMSRFQRLGFLVENGQLYLRDWQLYDEGYPEPYLDSVCTETSCNYDALPLMDGFRWKRSGNALSEFGAPLRPVPLPSSIGFLVEGGKGRIGKVTEAERKELSIEWQDDSGTTLIICSERGLRFDFPDGRHTLHMLYDDAEAEGTLVQFTPSAVRYEHNGNIYKVTVDEGKIDMEKRAFVPKGNVLVLTPTTCPSTAS